MRADYSTLVIRRWNPHQPEFWMLDSFRPTLLDSRLYGNDERGTALLRHSGEGRNPGIASEDRVLWAVAMDILVRPVSHRLASNVDSITGRQYTPVR